VASCLKRGLERFDRCMDVGRNRLGEERVRVAVSMVDVVTQISAENERERNPRITDSALISRLRRRFQVGRRPAK
jgi:hypothetical protein